MTVLDLAGAVTGTGDPGTALRSSLRVVRGSDEKGFDDSDQGW